ncbi:MAG TPA: hypothetical protein VHB50_23255, partial [Bryobacteraceae bacterium]|nr:hypothetical protein [Bryobacteraceae bacterium]
VAPGANWLVLGSANGSSTGAAPGSVNFSIDAGAAAALAPGAYYGTIRVTSGDVVNSPQDFEVVLNVVPATEPARPDPQPAGLVFISASGASSLPPQAVTVFASSTNSVLYQASAATSDGQAWLSVSPATGSTSASLPAQSNISVNLANLPPGVYQGGVSFAFSSAAVRTVNVTLIVQPQPGTTPQVAAPRLISHAAPACTPTMLVPTQTGLVNNFAQPVAWPTPLSIQLFNDCGIAVPDGQVVATFSNGDPPLPLTMADRSSGIYSGTWTPRSASSQMTISARATKSGLPAATARITGQVSPNNAPVLTPHGTLHVFDPLIGGALGPGNIVQIYGANLGGQTLAASTIPLPTSLGGTSVIIGGIQAPLYFASPGQINAQVPFELGAGKKYQVLVNANGALTTPDTIQLTDVSPGIAAFASGQIIAQHLDASLITETAPAKPGEIIVFYLAGLGQTDNPVATGAGTPLDRLSRPVDAPVLTLNGNNVPVLFAGLTPGLVGLYQVNFQVPNDAPDGDLQLAIVQNGAQSNSTILPVKK